MYTVNCQKNSPRRNNCKSYCFSDDNVLQVLPLAHEYQSPLVATCEDFMSQMCTPDKGLTVSTLLDYILAGEKYGLTSFLEAAMEFSAHVNFELLNGKMTIKSRAYFTNVYDTTIDNSIFLKFLKIDLETRYKIAKKRLQKIEMDRKRRENRDEVEEDYRIILCLEIKNANH